MPRTHRPRPLTLELSEQDVMPQLSAMAFGLEPLKAAKPKLRPRGRRRPLRVQLDEHDVIDQLPAMSLATEGWDVPDGSIQSVAWLGGAPR